MNDPAFGDGKESGALRTIGEVCQAFGLKPHVLRYWEQQFPMLRPLKRSGGRRYYRAQDVTLLRRIDHMVNREGFTLRGARLVLERESDQGAARNGHAADIDRQGATASMSREELIARLRTIRDNLAAALG